jgi:tetratricopeptide (TPR) repeat protein
LADDMDVVSEARPEADLAPGAVAQADGPLLTRGEPLFHATEAQARSLFAAGNHKKALAKVEAALKLKFNSPFTKARLLRLKADILIGLGRETDAQKARAEAARMDPTR